MKTYRIILSMILTIYIVLGADNVTSTIMGLNGTALSGTLGGFPYIMMVLWTLILYPAIYKSIK